MVQTAQSSYTYEVPLPYIILAHNQRYPSPYGTHILSSDVVSRSFSPETNTLTTVRLMNKRGKMPKWAPAFISQIGTSWVLEQSEITLDPTTLSLSPPPPTQSQKEEGGGGGGELRTQSRNLDHTKIMQVEEFQVFTQARRGNDDELATSSVTYSRITSDLDFWLLRDRVEKYGLSKLPKSISKVKKSSLFIPFRTTLLSLKLIRFVLSCGGSYQARLGLNLVATLVLQPSTCSTLLSSGPLNPYPFEPVPSPLSLALRAKLDEARQAWLVDQQAPRPGLDENNKGDRAGGGGGDEPGKVWRMRWRAAVKRGRQKFRDRVCKVTGLLCDERFPRDCATTSSTDDNSGGGVLE